MNDYTPFDWTKVFPPRPTKLEEYFNDLYERCTKMYNWSDNGKQISYQEAKLKLNSLYGRLAMPEKENNMKDYIVVHCNNGDIGIILKKAISAITKRRGNTAIYFDGVVLFCDDKYEDIIKQYLGTK